MRKIDSISNFSDDFSSYLDKFFESNETKYFWDNFKRLSDAFVFGGLIKNFFKDRNKEPRDFDFVVTSLDDAILQLVEPYLERKNQFGGLKLKVGNYDIDIWEIDNTWALKKEKPLYYQFDFHLPKTSFFNATAIIYSLQRNEFIFDNSFQEFIEKEKLDIVNKLNPYPELCIVKTYEYVKNYGYKLSTELLNYLNAYFNIKRSSLEEIQLKHYGNVIFQIEELEDFLNTENKKELKRYYSEKEKSKKKLLKKKSQEEKLPFIEFYQ